jgi:CubicO group peptidase (beta-lactamase class C family)
MTHEEIGDLAQRTADLLAQRHVGVVVGAVREDGGEIRAAGRTSLDPAGVRPDAGTLFEIGSVTKVFTALALARTVLGGVVDLDEPVRDLLAPGTVTPSRGGQEFTPRHLSTHTSGLPRLPKGMLWLALRRPTASDPYSGCTAPSVLEGLAATKLRSNPGERFWYSNLGGGLLGIALANRTGTEYEPLVIREVCAPLGLTDTVITLDEDRASRLAQGHTRRRRPTPPWHLGALAGAGGLRSNASDMVAFARTHLDGQGSEMADAIRLCVQTRHQTNRRSWAHLGWERRPPRRTAG